MSPEKAKKRLFIGHTFAVIGLFVGSSIELLQPYPLINILWMGYLFWSTYLGFYIVYRPMQSFFANLFLIRENLASLLLAYLMLKVVIFMLILTAGVLVGVFGGAIYLQHKWSKIAYF